MLGVLLGIALPTLIFGVFALLAMFLGAETRPWFDERPVRDDRPNWGPIARYLPIDLDEEEALELGEPDDGTPQPVAAPAAHRQSRPTAITRAATSPSGV
jgi:hypothetical protein